MRRALAAFLAFAVVLAGFTDADAGRRRGSTTQVAGPSVIDRFEKDNADPNKLPLTPYGLSGVGWALNRSGSVTTNPRVVSGGVVSTDTSANSVSTFITVAPTGAVLANRRYSYIFDATGFGGTSGGTCCASTIWSGNLAPTNSTSLYTIIGLNEITPTSSHSGLRFRYLNSANGGGLTGAYLVSGSLTGAGTALTFTGDGNALDLSAGDTFAFVPRVSGASLYLDVEKNGWQVLAGTQDLIALATAQGFTLTTAAGINGQLQSTVKLDEFRVSATDTEPDLWFVHDTHICQIAWWNAGDTTACNLNLTLKYAGGVAPTSLTYTIYDATGPPTAVAALTDLPFTFTDAGSSTLTHFNLIVPSASMPAKFYVEVKWPRLKINGFRDGYITARTPVIMPGEKEADDGQSRVKFFWFTGGITGLSAYTPAANFWTQDGSEENILPAVNMNRRTSRADTTSIRANVGTAAAYAAYIASTGFGHSNLEYIRNGYGGKDQLERGIASTYWNTFFTQGLPRATDLGTFPVIDHAWETDNHNGNYPAGAWGASSIALWKAEVYAKIQAIEAYVGHPIIVPLGTPIPLANDTWAGTVAAPRTDAFVRMLSDIIATNGDGNFTTYGGVQRFVWSYSVDDWSWDGTHGTNVAASLGLQGWRAGHAWACARGITSACRRGPVLTGVSVNRGADTITGTFNAWTATSAAIRNDPAAISDYSLAHHFVKDCTFTVAKSLTPTAVGTPSAVSGGSFTVTWTFGAGTLTAASNICVSGPRGSNPSSPTNTLTPSTANANAALLTLDYGDPESAVFDPPAERTPNVSGGNDYFGPL